MRRCKVLVFLSSSSAETLAILLVDENLPNVVYSLPLETVGKKIDCYTKKSFGLSIQGRISWRKAKKSVLFGRHSLNLESSALHVKKYLSNVRWRVLVTMSAALILSACGGGSDSSSPANAQTFSLSGDVFVDDYSEQDADIQIAGLANIASQNNDIANAQRLNNPTSLGGYISAGSGNYRNGEIYSRDVADVYSLPMLKGQSLVIQLQSAESASSSALNVLVNVYRARNKARPIYSEQAFIKGARLEFVAEIDDEYFVELSADQAGSAPVLYQLKTSTTLASGVALAQGSYSELASDRITYLDESGKLIRTSSKSDADLAKLSALREAQELATASGLRAEPDYKARITASSVFDLANDTYRVFQWNVDLIKAPDAWAASTGDGVRVAIIDTGIASNHEDLQRNVLQNEGYDFVSSTGNGDGDGRDADPTDPAGGTFHGSHISGVIAAETNNMSGIAGIAYDAHIIPIRVLDKAGSGSAFDIADGIRYAAGLSTSEGLVLSPRADIINLSLGLNEDSFVIRDAIRDAVAAGVIVVAAAGNEGSDAAFYPAYYPEVFGVGSVNHEGYRSLFSNFGANVSVMAPGGTDQASIYFDGINDDILGPVGADNYAFYVGTSFAAPHVAAVAALMKQLDSGLDAVSFASLLNRGLLTDVREDGSYYGRGVLNAEKAVAAVGGVLSDRLDAFPESLSYTQNDERLTLTLSNLGDGVVSVDQLTFDVPWLSITGEDISSLGLGRYAITIDSAAAGVQARSANVEVLYSVNGGGQQLKTIPVFKASEAVTSELKGVYVYLLRKESVTSFSSSYEIVQSVFFERILGSASFSFDNIPAGNYFLEASTDNDGDRRLFDPGEALGAYRLSNSESYLSLRSDRDGLRFSMQYQDLSETNEYAHSFDPQIDRALP